MLNKHLDSIQEFVIRGQFRTLSSNRQSYFVVQIKLIVHFLKAHVNQFSESQIKFPYRTVRAGNLGQISTLTQDCDVIEFLRTLLSREDWLILI
jgi:hypothetical protein